MRWQEIGEWGKKSPKLSESVVCKPLKTSAGLLKSGKKKKKKKCGDLMTEQWMLQYKYIQGAFVVIVVTPYSIPHLAILVKSPSLYRLPPYLTIFL